MNRKIFFFSAILFVLLNPAWSAEFRQQVTPLPPPEPPADSNQILTAPAKPLVNEFPIVTEEAGRLGWHQNAELSAAYIFENLLQGTLCIDGDLVYDDPNCWGRKLGLAEDALEYKLGLGVAFGYDNDNELIFSIPLKAGATLHFKDQEFYGYDSYIGFGLSFNLIGTNFCVGGLGYQLYGGVLADLGWPGGQTGLAIGYEQLNVANIRTTKGYYLCASQPLKL